MIPSQAFERLIEYVGPRDYTSKWPVGSVVLRQPNDVREALSRLTTADVCVRRDVLAYCVDKRKRLADYVQGLDALDARLIAGRQHFEDP